MDIEMKWKPVGHDIDHSISSAIANHNTNYIDMDMDMDMSMDIVSNVKIETNNENKINVAFCVNLIDKTNTKTPMKSSSGHMLIFQFNHVTTKLEQIGYDIDIIVLQIENNDDNINVNA